MTSPTPPAPPAQPRNPLHGLTLETIVTALVAHYGWQELGRRIPVRCFTCGKVLGEKWTFYERRVRETGGEEQEEES